MKMLLVIICSYFINEQTRFKKAKRLRTTQRLHGRTKATVCYAEEMTEVLKKQC